MKNEPSEQTNKRGYEAEDCDESELCSSRWLDDDGERESILGEEGCCYPEHCCMPGPHYVSECHTAEDLMALEESSRRGNDRRKEGPQK